MQVSDVYSRMYLPPKLLEAAGRGENRGITVFQRLLNLTAAENRPLRRKDYGGVPIILCEYAHAMENSLGNFQEYTDLFHQYPKLAGGFIWDFSDQALRMPLHETANSACRTPKDIPSSFAAGGYKRWKEQEIRWLYGGDFGEEKTHGYFCANGITAADRSLHPSIHEVKKGYQPVRLRLHRLVSAPERQEFPNSGEMLQGNYHMPEFPELAEIVLINDFLSTNLDVLHIHISCFIEGDELFSKQLPCTSAKPGKEVLLPLPVKKWADESAEQIPYEIPYETSTASTAGQGDIYIRVSIIKSPRSTLHGKAISEAAAESPFPWAPKGYEFAWEEFSLNPPSRSSSAEVFKHNEKTSYSLGEQEQNVRYTVTGDEVSLTSKNVRINISIQLGGITGLYADKKNILHSPILPEFLRALTDNDREFSNFYPSLRFLVDDEGRFSLRRRKPSSYSLKTHADGSVSVKIIQQRKNFSGPLCLYYSLYPDGSIHIAMEGRPRKELFRFGFTFALPRSNYHFDWFGRGPHETYSDRKGGAKLGKFSLPLSAMPHSYLRPQENGNREELRYAVIREEEPFSSQNSADYPNSEKPFFGKVLSGNVLSIHADSPGIFSLGAGPWSRKELNKTEHVHELPSSEAVFIHADGYHRGVGGDFPGMSHLHEPYRLPGGVKYSFSWKLSILKQNFKHVRRYRNETES